MTKRFDPSAVVLPLLGVGVVLLIWTIISQTVAPDLPSPAQNLERVADLHSASIFQGWGNEPGDRSLRRSEPPPGL